MAQDPREKQGTAVDQSTILRVTGVNDTVQDPWGWFGPGNPLRPQAQDKAVDRAFDFPVGFNQRTQPRQGEGTTFSDLRALADNYDLLRLVIETRKDQIEAFEWEIVAEDAKSTVSRASEIMALTDFMHQPSFEYDWPTWIRLLCDDLLVIDAVAIYPRMNRRGDLLSLDLLDGGTIKRVLDSTGRTPLPPDPAYQQILKGVPAVNYSTEELVYWMKNPRSYRAYGFSPVEQVLMTVNIALRRQLTQLQYFTEGNIPEAIAGTPEGWTPDQVAQFQVWWDGLLAGNTANRSHMKFVPIDPTKIKETRNPELKDMYDEWLARIVCFAFSIPPHPFVKETNRSTAETAAAAAKEEGLLPTLKFLERRINSLLTRYAGVKGLKFRWKIQTNVDPDVQAGIDDRYIRSGVLSVDEVRESLGKEKIGVGNMVYTGTGATPILLLAQQTELPSATPPAAPEDEDPDKGDESKKEDTKTTEGKPAEKDEAK